MEFKVKTKSNTQPQGKRRVYFTCHKNDFDKCFETICSDIFDSQDCAVYYTEDMNASYDDKDLELSQMNLFVIPVTFQLLTEPNRAIDEDYPFALEKHIPILPIMMETALDELYQSKFEKIEYLDRIDTDRTAISYSEKLQKYLKAVLMSDEMAERIRLAFDAYIFLSYRKKDRKFANELMRLIHNNERCRDIAIWYDEFLVPGENFEDTIRHALEKSKLFTMVVTPNIIEEGNYIQRIEYPEARKMGKSIMPVEMVDTDKDIIKDIFEDIPKCLKAEDQDFYDLLINIISEKGKETFKDLPEHNFLIGLAYLDGIDVEKDADRGIELITSSAESGLIEAMEKLCDIYHDGIGTEKDGMKWLEWLEKCCKCAEDKYGPSDIKTIDLKEKLSVCYDDLGRYNEAVEVGKYVMETRIKLQGEWHTDTLRAYTNLANFEFSFDEYDEASQLLAKAYKGYVNELGEEAPETLRVRRYQAYIVYHSHKYEEALRMFTELYELNKKSQGEHSSLSYYYRRFIVYCYDDMGEFLKAKDLLEQICKEEDNFLQENDTEKLYSYTSLSVFYKRLGQFDKAISIMDDLYNKFKKVLGEEHPEILKILSNKAEIYSIIGNYEESLKIRNHNYFCVKNTYGENNIHTYNALYDIAICYFHMRDYEKALEYIRIIRGKDTHILEKYKGFMGDLDVVEATCYYTLKDYEKAISVGKEAYNIYCDKFGEQSSQVINIILLFTKIYNALEQYEKAIEMGEKVYNFSKNSDGENAFTTLISKVEIGELYSKKGDIDIGTEILEDATNKLEKIIGEEHAVIITKKAVLIDNYLKKGRRKEAIDLGEYLIGLYKKVFGEDDSKTKALIEKINKISE